jgi:nicotinamidase-related amidase
MTTLDNRPNTALIVVDVQNGVVANAYERNAIVATINQLVEKAHREQVPVVWVQDMGEDRKPGNPSFDVVPELSPAPDDPRIVKEYGDSFEATNLETVLSDLEVGRVFVTGAQTDACIRSTIHGALTRGYDTFLVGDAHTTEDLTEWGAPPPDQVIAHTNLYWRYHAAPGREAGTVQSTDVDFGSRS